MTAMWISSFLPPKADTNDEVFGGASKLSLYAQALKFAVASSLSEPTIETFSELPTTPGYLARKTPSDESIVAFSNASKSFIF